MFESKFRYHPHKNLFSPFSRKNYLKSNIDLYSELFTQVIRSGFTSLWFFQNFLVGSLTFGLSPKLFFPWSRPWRGSLAFGLAPEQSLDTPNAWSSEFSVKSIPFGSTASLRANSFYTNRHFLSLKSVERFLIVVVALFPWKRWLFSAQIFTNLSKFLCEIIHTRFSSNHSTSAALWPLDFHQNCS